MAGLVEFVRRLLNEGEVVFRESPQPRPSEGELARELLRQVYDEYRLEVAGPPLEFCGDTALAAAEFVRQACWFLVHRGEPGEEVERRLQLPPPRTPAEHLSADVVLRHVPQLERRARLAAPDDPLAVRLAQVLRQWPLAGVLSDVAEAPLTPPDFGGHPGLQMLYAERLAESDKPAWVPAGAARAYVELVFDELGKEVPAEAAPQNGDEA